MNDQRILNAIAAMSQELTQKICDRDVLNVRIMELEKNIRNLRSSFMTNILAEEGRQLTAVGLTEAIRTVLRRSGSKALSAADVKDTLNVLGFDLKKFQNPSAVVHNTLIRMAKSGEITFLPESKTYRLPLRSVIYGDVPNPFGKNLTEMLTEPTKKKK